MRNVFALVAVFVCVAFGTAVADPVKAKAANTRGYNLHKKKKYKEAAVEYRAAITEDPTLLVAHYNLACVASLAKDKDTALNELAWVTDRATWDKAALAAIKKAGKDKDLKWIRDEHEDGKRLTTTEIPDDGAYDIVKGAMPELSGKKSTDANLVKVMAGAPGKHEQKCSSVAYAGPETAKGGTVAVNLRDGVTVVDAAGKVAARSEPIGCTSDKDQIIGLTQSRGVWQAFELTDQEFMGTRLIAVSYGAGAGFNITVYARKGNQLNRAFDAVLSTKDGDGALLQTPILGNLVYTAPGAKKPKVFRWDAASSKFVPETP